MVLKVQLLVEHSLAQFVSERAPAMAEVIKDQYCPVGSGLGLIRLAQALSLRDEIPPTCSDELWPALIKLNALRNRLVHDLYPDRNKLIRHMKDFVKHVSGDPVRPNEDITRTFYRCAQLLIGYLALNRRPSTLADTE